MRKLYTCFIALCCLFYLEGRCDDKKFVIFIPTYNNEQVCKENILSALNQKYEQFRIIVVNDCSNDKTSEIIKETIAVENKNRRVTVVDNQVRRKALANFFYTIHEQIDNDEIVVCLDGDDKLAHSYVLAYLNQIYSSPSKEVWLTYGQFQEMQSGAKGFCCLIPKNVIRRNDFRQWPHVPSHLRTYYAWLFKKIHKEDLLIGGQFFDMSGDLAFMMPMIEMAGYRFQFIDKILYLYNDTNPISDHCISRRRQIMLDEAIRNKKRYNPLPHSGLSSCNTSTCNMCKAKKD